jgi:hypothetical protein
MGMMPIELTKMPEYQDGLCYTDLYDDYISKGKTMQYLKQNNGDGKTVARVNELTGNDIFLHFTPTNENENWFFIALNAWDEVSKIEYNFLVHNFSYDDCKIFDSYENAKQHFIKKCEKIIEQLDNKEKYQKQINEFKNEKERL